MAVVVAAVTQPKLHVWSGTIDSQCRAVAGVLAEAKS